jgi:hypothetical protein
MALPVPPEITSQIFSLIPPGVVREQEPDPTIGPLLFMKVCRERRALALSTPALWNTISVVFDAQVAESKPGHQALCRLMNQWLSRSGKYPLHISYSIQGWQKSPEVISTALMQYAHQVETLDLYREPELLAELLDGLTISLPILRKFSARGLSWIEPSPHGSFSILQHSPLLRELSLHISLEYPLLGSIHWQALTQFSGGIFIYQAYEIIHLAPNLEELELDTSDDLPVTQVTLHRLHKLTLVSMNDTAILEWLTLPQLDDLHMFVPSVHEYTGSAIVPTLNHTLSVPLFLDFLV